MTIIVMSAQIIEEKGKKNALIIGKMMTTA